MTRNTFVMDLCFFTVLFTLFPTLAVSQAVQPSTDALPQVNSPFTIIYSSFGNAGSASVAPLTPETGIGQSTVALNVIKILGNLRLFDAASNVRPLDVDDIAYISCDSTADANVTNPAAEPINVAGAQRPSAILLYSLVEPHCAIRHSFDFKTIFSMTSAKESLDLQNLIKASAIPPTAVIADAATMASASALSNVTSGPPQSSNDPSPGTPTTAVAMSILYSITGIITLLFLIIIATGAVRAHRNPERYGPRTGFAGRPSQSRAKGLARAMLETLPIIKFGDPEPVKDGTRDVELQEGSAEEQSAAGVAEQPAESNQEPDSSDDAEATTESGMGPDTRAPSGLGTSNHIENTDDVEALGCPICTDDFEIGQDVRVLPCSHKFHPDCVDPWLLNVSGTCPLCRVNLASSDGRPENEEEDNFSPPLAAVQAPTDLEGPSSSGEARPLDASLLRQASATERIAALRELRQLRGSTSGSGNHADNGEEQRRSARVSRWLKDVFRVTTRSETNGRDETS